MRTCTKTEKSQYALWGHVLKWKKNNIWQKSWNANNENTVVLGRIYRSILSSCLGIEGQYGPPPSLRSGGQPVLRLNSSAWWQYWPIHPPQNYSIPPILTLCKLQSGSIGFYSPLYLVLRSKVFFNNVIYCHLKSITYWYHATPWSFSKNFFLSLCLFLSVCFHCL